MRNIGIITINDNNNYGNRLQNYALQFFLENNNIKCSTIVYGTKKKRIQEIIKIIINYKNQWNKEKRFKHFISFNNNINIEYIKKINELTYNNKDYYIVGSDQVWNPLFDRLTDYELLSCVDPEKRISYAASFGISELPEEVKDSTAKELKKFKAISVREDRGKEIVEELTGRKDVEVLIDPTMLLDSKDWENVSKKPEQLKTDKFILNYFLGELSSSRKKEIERIAKENNCEIINIMDKNGPYYATGPSEFLYLEKNAFLICTDSFHSSVFAILFDRPFIIFEREDKEEKMNSRLETLINKFKLKNRKFEGKITNENLNHDYSEAYKILKKERKKSYDFLTKSLK